jgi:hypothetical protein
VEGEGELFGAIEGEIESRCSYDPLLRQPHRETVRRALRPDPSAGAQLALFGEGA